MNQNNHVYAIKVTRKIPRYEVVLGYIYCPYDNTYRNTGLFSFVEHKPMQYWFFYDIILNKFWDLFEDFECVEYFGIIK